MRFASVGRENVDIIVLARDLVQLFLNHFYTNYEKRLTKVPPEIATFWEFAKKLE